MSGRDLCLSPVLVPKMAQTTAAVVGSTALSMEPGCYYQWSSWLWIRLQRLAKKSLGNYSLRDFFLGHLISSWALVQPPAEGWVEW